MWDTFILHVLGIRRMRHDVSKYSLLNLNLVKRINYLQAAIVLHCHHISRAQEDELCPVLRVPFLAGPVMRKASHGCTSKSTQTSHCGNNLNNLLDAVWILRPKRTFEPKTKLSLTLYLQKILDISYSSRPNRNGFEQILLKVNDVD